MKLYAPSTIREIREKYGFRLTKSLGQNFLTDKNIIDDIIDGAAIGAQDLVIEIGPAIGVLTWEMFEAIGLDFAAWDSRDFTWEWFDLNGEKLGGE